MNGIYKYVTLSQPKLLGPILPALGGGGACRPLALAFHRHWPGDSFPAATDPQDHGRRCLKTEMKIMKLKVQSVPEILFDQPIHRTTRTPGVVIARYPGFVANNGHRRTVEANQARIDLWKFLEDSSR